MKKLLLATSILAATTGYAAAEVALTGDARMGVVYDGQDVQFSQRARVNFNLSGQTDTGLEFGASFRADQASGSASGNFLGESGDSKRGTVWISGAFGKLAMGDTNSAAEEAFGDLTSIGYTGLGDYTDIPYINGDGSDTLDQGPAALYSYTMGGFEFHLGMQDGSAPNHDDVINDFDGNASTAGDDNTISGDVNGIVAVGEGEERDTAYSVALAYAGDTYKVGIAYLDNGDVSADQSYGGSQWMVYGETEVAGFGLKAYYADFDDYFGSFDLLATGDGLGRLETEKSFGLTADYKFGATTVAGFARRDDISSNVAGLDGDYDTFGLGAVYDLGGGASLRGGVVNTDRFIDVSGGDIDRGETIADVGLRLNF